MTMITQEFTAYNIFLSSTCVVMRFPITSMHKGDNNKVEFSFERSKALNNNDVVQAYWARDSPN